MSRVECHASTSRSPGVGLSTIATLARPDLPDVVLHVALEPEPADDHSRDERDGQSSGHVGDGELGSDQAPQQHDRDLVDHGRCDQERERHPEWHAGLEEPDEQRNGRARAERRDDAEPRGGRRSRGGISTRQRLPNAVGRHERAEEGDERHDAGQEQQHLGHVVEEEGHRLAELRAVLEAQDVESQPQRHGQREEPGGRPQRSADHDGEPERHLEPAYGQRGHASTSSSVRSAAAQASAIALVVQEATVRRVAHRVDEPRLAQPGEVVRDVVLPLPERRGHLAHAVRTVAQHHEDRCPHAISEKCRHGLRARDVGRREVHPGLGDDRELGLHRGASATGTAASRTATSHGRMCHGCMRCPRAMGHEAGGQSDGLRDFHPTWRPGWRRRDPTPDRAAMQPSELRRSDGETPARPLDLGDGFRQGNGPSVSDPWRTGALAALDRNVTSPRVMGWAWNGAPGRTRTADAQLRTLPLYPLSYGGTAGPSYRTAPWKSSAQTPVSSWLRMASAAIAMYAWSSSLMSSGAPEASIDARM